MLSFVYIIINLTKGETRLMYFLRNASFDVDRARKNIDLYYASRSSLPDIYQHSNPTTNSWQEREKHVSVCPLPDLTPDSKRVLLIRVNDLDPETKDMNKVIAECLIHPQEVRSFEDVSEGDIIIIDQLCLKPGNVSKFGPKEAKHISFILEHFWNRDGMEWHFVNSKDISDPMIKNSKKYFYKELGRKVFSHNSFQDLFKVIPREIFPRDYGGNLKVTFDELEDNWRNKLHEYKDRFDHFEKLTTLEELRPSTSEHSDVGGFIKEYLHVHED